MSAGGSTSARAQPFYCPYCGEQDFRPFGEEPSQFLCGSCARHYTVRFLGLQDAAATAGGRA
jgi:transposase-like protein